MITDVLPTILRKLADALRCTLNYLMTGRESPYPERRDGKRQGASKSR